MNLFGDSDALVAVDQIGNVAIVKGRTAGSSILRSRQVTERASGLSLAPLQEGQTLRCMNFSRCRGREKA